MTDEVSQDTPLSARQRRVRPRGGQTWRERQTGRTIRLWWRRTFNPMGSVRPHSDLRHTVVGGIASDGRFVYEHESDFVTKWDFVTGRSHD